MRFFDQFKKGESVLNLGDLACFCKVNALRAIFLICFSVYNAQNLTIFTIFAIIAF